ncbi:unnamed protein product [Closterium sp. Naga37s-1]|nr:unnamed protein product [Closterium sp. Naga37s-1]
MEDAMPAGGWTDAEATGAGASSRPDGAGDTQGSQCDGRRLRFFDHAMRKACWEKADVVPGRHPDRYPSPPRATLTAPDGEVTLEFAPKVTSSLPATCGAHCPGWQVARGRGGQHAKFPTACACLLLCTAPTIHMPAPPPVRHPCTTAPSLPSPPCPCTGAGGATSVENCQLLQTRVNRFKSDKDQLSPQEYSHASCHLTLTDKDLDLVEMAVYGDVVRPGMQCRVTTVAEAMGVLPPAPRRRPTKPQQQYGACHWPGAASEQAQGSLS